MQNDDLCRCGHPGREHARALGRGKRNYLCLMAGCTCNEFAKQEPVPAVPGDSAKRVAPQMMPGFFV